MVTFFKFRTSPSPFFCISIPSILTFGDVIDLTQSIKKPSYLYPHMTKCCGIILERKSSLHWLISLSFLLVFVQWSFLDSTVILHCMKRAQNKCKIGQWRLLNRHFQDYHSLSNKTIMPEVKDLQIVCWHLSHMWSNIINNEAFVHLHTGQGLPKTRNRRCQINPQKIKFGSTGIWTQDPQICKHMR